MHPGNALNYDYTVAKYFMFATILFGIVGMAIGTLIAFQMAYPNLNYLAGEYATFQDLDRFLFWCDFWFYAFRDLGNLVLYRTACS